MNAPLNHPLPLLDLDVLRTFVAIAETGSRVNAINSARSALNNRFFIFILPFCISWPIRFWDGAIA